MDEKLEHYYQIKKKLIVENISDSAFRVCSLIISYADENIAFPSLRTMAKILHKSKTTVKKAVDELVDKSILEKVNRKTENGKNSSNLYKINKKYLVPINFKTSKREVQAHEIYDLDWLDVDG